MNDNFVALVNDALCNIHSIQSDEQYTAGSLLWNSSALAATQLTC